MFGWFKNTPKDQSTRSTPTVAEAITMSTIANVQVDADGFVYCRDLFIAGDSRPDLPYLIIRDLWTGADDQQVKAIVASKKPDGDDQ
jgi:hypothetical protein